MAKSSHSGDHFNLPKSPTGIEGLDEITGGGLPRGRPTLVTGSAGSGKTLFAVEFLVRGAIQFNEPGVFVAFEEMPEELVQNVKSLGFDIKSLQAKKQLVIDHVRIERAEIEETGEYDLEGLFIRLAYAIDSIGAKRIVLDTVEALFGGLSNTSVLRSELRRLFTWLKAKKVTAIITAERGDGALTRHGLEEYVSDAVIILDHRVTDQISTRRLRVVKYRGSSHGTNEYPFLIDEQGFHVLPVTSLKLDHAAAEERISTGIPRLDAMLGGEGYYRGTSILVSGTAGSGKTSVAGHFADAACRRGERCLYFAFEESPSQVIRNMRSIGLHLSPWIKQGLLRYHASRPTLYGLEMHLATMHKAIREFDPQVVVVDPVTDLMAVGTEMDVKLMVTRLVDFLKSKGITALFTSLTGGGTYAEQTEVGISSLIDTWLLLREIESNGERNRGMYILKSRGMKHSNQIREFILTDQGVRLVDAYVGPAGVLTGSARLAQEAREHAAAEEQARETERRIRELERKRKLIEAQIASLESELKSAEAESQQALTQQKTHVEQLERDRDVMAVHRGADQEPTKEARPRGTRGDGKKD